MKRNIIGMKRTIILVLCCMILAISGCSQKSSGTEYRFTGTILEINGNRVLVEALEGEDIRRSSDKIEFSSGELEDIQAKVGDTVSIVYSGEIMETYPAQITALSWSVVQRAEDSDTSETDRESRETSQESGELSQGTSKEPHNADSRDLDTVKQHLSEYSNDFADLEKAQCYMSVHGIEHHGSEYWDEFYGKVQKNEPAQIDIIQFTMEGDAVIDYISYDGSSFYVVHDSSRDAFAASGDKYFEEEYPYLKVFEGTETNGDRYRYIYLMNDNTLSLEEIQAYLSGDEEGRDENGFLLCVHLPCDPSIHELGADVEPLKIREIAHIIRGNENSEVSGNEAWHEVETSFDESAVLIPAQKIGSIQVINGNTGEEKVYSEQSDGDTFKEILDLYENLDFAPGTELQERIGYSYLLGIFDKEGNRIQTVQPYKDAVQISGTIYDGSMNGSCVQLLLKLDLLW